MPMLFAILALSTLCARPALGQTPPPAPPAPPATRPEAYARLWANALERWHLLGTKVVALARNFPQEKSSFRFHPETRTFLEEIWHETFDQQMFGARLSGTATTIDSRKLFLGEGRPTDLQEAADELEAVLKAVGAVLQTDNPPLAVASTLDFHIEHLSVTYGGLAAMYRANGLVPPLTVDNRERAEERRKAGVGN